MQLEPVLRTGFQELWGYDLLFSAGRAVKDRR